MIKSIKKCVCIVLVLTAILTVFTGCVKNQGIPGGDFIKQESIFDALKTKGNTTLTLEKDEKVDITGIDITGRKEINLNNHKLTIVGIYKFNANGILDIKSGEGSSESILDLSVLEFDLEAAPTDNIDNISIIDIDSEINLIEPVYSQRIGMRDYGILKEIHIKSAE